MVRAAVRTLTLSVYRVREPSLEKFLLERISKPYFTQLIYDCQQIAIKIDTQHETGQVAQELLNEERDFLMSVVFVSDSKHIRTEPQNSLNGN